MRAKGVLNVGGILQSQVWLDSEILVGDFLKTDEFALRALIERPTFADLDWTVADNEDYLLRQRLFRAFSTLYFGQTALTLGRQRIAWGSGFVWNPTDLFNPFNPVAIELDEKEGVDAAYLMVPVASLSRIELAYAPGRNALQSSIALRLGSHLGSYDLNVMAGEFLDDLVFGGDFAGYVGGAGLRGEFAYTWTNESDNYFRAILNADYNFPSGLYLFVEVYINGQGATDKNNYDLTNLLLGRTFNLARYYSAISLSKLLTPLLSANLYSIINLTDNSALIGPAIKYSLATNLELSASAYFLFGQEDTEFGQLKSSYFAFLQFYF